MSNLSEDVGPVSLVTGAASGIGRATALALAARGDIVAVSDRDERGGTETLRAVETAGGQGCFVPCDVAQAGQVDALVASIVERFGKLDVAVNNAGVGSPATPTAEISEAEWDRVTGVNAKGVWLCMRAEIRAMLQSGGGAIVNVASVAGLVGFPGEAAYCAAKHAVVGITKTAAVEYAPAGIRVNAVCPGAIQTAMVDELIAGGAITNDDLVASQPIGRVGAPEEVAQMILWLASDAASLTTGAAIPVDGAWTAR